MFEQIVLAGSGGQGIQFAGQLLVRAAVQQNLEATYVPSYGAERRGGTSFCFVVVADRPIHSPVFKHSDVLLAFDQRARLQYGPLVKGTGLMLFNSDLAAAAVPEEQARLLAIPATSLAQEIHRDGGINLIMLGAYLALERTVQLETVKTVLQTETAKHPEWLEYNLKALQKGA
jgi:2-oxoglutarate ferredoxin oxidoreductase subunit gamma